VLASKSGSSTAAGASAGDASLAAAAALGAGLVGVLLGSAAGSVVAGADSTGTAEAAQPLSNAPETSASNHSRVGLRTAMPGVCSLPAFLASTKRLARRCGAAPR
jgi:hypothetical protein